MAAEEQASSTPHDGRTREELLGENEMLRRRIADLEAAQSQCAVIRRAALLGSSRTDSQGCSCYLQEMAETIRDVFWVFDWRTQKVVYASPAYEEIWGRSIRDLYDRYEEWGQSVHPDDRQAATESFARAVETGGGEPREYRIVRPDGQVRWISDRAYAVRDADGTVTHITGLAEDITERKRAEEEVRTSQTRLRAAMESLPFDFFMLDRDERYVMINSVCREDWGIRVGQRPEEACPDEGTLALWKDNNRRALSGEVVTGEVEMAPQGRAGYYYNVISPIRDGDEIRGILGVHIDITALKRAEAALRESETKFRNLAEQSPNMIFINYRGRVVYVNARCEECMGYTKQEFYARDFDFLRLAAPEHRDRVMENFRRHMSGQEVPPVEYTFCTRQGQRIDAILGTKLITYDGEPAILGIVTDITDRKRVEAALRESEEKFRNLAEQSPNMIFINQGGRITYVNARCEECMGYTKQEFYARDFDFLRLVAPEYRDLMRENYGRHLSGEEVPEVEYALCTRDGRRIEALLATKLIQYQGEPAILGTVTDITALKQAEESLQQAKEDLEQRVRERTAELEAEVEWRHRVEVELRESEERYRTLVENSGHAIAAINEVGEYLFANQTSADYFSLDPQEMVGRTIWEFFPKDVADEHMEHVRSVIRSGVGSTRTTPSQIGGQLRWFSATVEPLGADGKIGAAMVIARDVTDLAVAKKQLEEYREQMTRADRLASLGTMSAMVAHELTQPLTVLRLSIQNALEAIKSGSSASAVKEDLENSVEEVATMTGIVERFRGFARASSPSRQFDVNLPAIAAHMVEVTAEAAQRARVSVSLEGLDALPPFTARAKDIEQVFFALLMNAIQAADGATDRTIVVRGQTRDGEIELLFEDTCGGLDPDHIDKIFEPFFTTKGKTGGTGLGLCVVEHILDRYQAKIQVQNRPGQGVTFRVTLPLSASSSL
ncbi:MAG: PAS domain S-box protein [Phycisphaerales bacterium]|nr:MAG: PAS domain S-box protein [Phycisphaerales bacterium]